MWTYLCVVVFLFVSGAKSQECDMKARDDCMWDCLGQLDGDGHVMVAEAGTECTGCRCRRVCEYDQLDCLATGKVCQPQTVICFRDPCPPIPVCVDGDDAHGAANPGFGFTGSTTMGRPSVCPSSCGWYGCDPDTRACLGCPEGRHGAFCENDYDCTDYECCRGTECVMVSTAGARRGVSVAVLHVVVMSAIVMILGLM